MTKKKKKKVDATTVDVDAEHIHMLQAANERLQVAAHEAQQALAAEQVKNAIPVLTVKADSDHLLIVECQGFSMRVRTRSVIVSTSKV